MMSSPPANPPGLQRSRMLMVGLGYVALMGIASLAFFVKAFQTPAEGLLWTFAGAFAFLNVVVTIGFLLFHRSLSKRLASMEARVIKFESSFHHLSLEFGDRFDQFGNRFDQVEAQNSEQKKELNRKASGQAVKLAHEKIETLLGRIQALSSQTKKMGSGEAVKLANNKADALSTRIKSLEELPQELRRVSSMVKQCGSGEAVASASAKIEKLTSRFEHFERLNENYHVHKRKMTRTDVMKLIEEWADPLDVKHTKKSIRYLADRIVSLEAACVGRLATDIQTIIARTIAASSLRETSPQFVEIGTLFGIAAGCIHDACRFHYDDIKMILIDPLDGYYDRAEKDIITQAPVTRMALDENLKRMFVPKSSVEILQGLSEDKASIAAMTGRSVDFLVIDGDHSYNGVKRDYDNYVGFMKPGGLIVFDDYDTEDWPEIKNYVDTEIEKDDRVKKVVSGFRTALYRVN